MKNINQYRPQLAELTLKDPVQYVDITGATMKLASLYSKKFQEARNAVLDKVESGSYELPKTKTASDLAYNQILSTVIISWNDEFFMGPCTEENVLNLLNDPEMEWVRTQVIQFVTDSKHFFLN